MSGHIPTEPYLDALQAMHELLGALGEEHWRSWIARDIAEWEADGTVSHHLMAYGGMGSFNDVCFDDVWLGALFEDLKSVCHHFAHHPRAKPDVRALESSMGTVGFELSGWRCLACGYGVVSRREMDVFIARRVIRASVLREAGRTRVVELVRSAILRPPQDDRLAPGKVADWVQRSGIDIRERDGWLRPCPRCAGDQTAIYRWLLKEDGRQPFVPSSDNLPLRRTSKGPPPSVP